MNIINTLVFSGIGLLFIVLGLPLIRRSVKPNAWYGFRVKKTLSNIDIWYAANRVMGYDMLAAGLFIFISSILVYAISHKYPSIPLLNG